jgi:hypothetical protein
LDQPALLEPLSEAGEPAAGHQAPFGEIGHPHAPRARLTEQGKHAVLGHAHVQRGEPGLHRTPQPLMSEQEPSPGFHLDVPQALSRHVATVSARRWPGQAACAGKFPEYLSAQTSY